MDEKLRDVYNRFGPGALSFDPRHDELRLISDIGATYVFWLLLMCASTFSAGARAARTWTCIWGVIVMVLHFSFSISDVSVPKWLPCATYLTEAELLTLCHRAFPGIMVALRCVSEWCYVDVNETSAEFLKQVGQQFSSTQAILGQLHEAVSADSSSSGGGGGGKGSRRTEDIRAAVDELSASLKDVNAKCSQMIEHLKNSNSDPASNYYWLVLIAVYGLIYLSGASGEAGGPTTGGGNS
jgi:hypothetical protein